MSKFLLKSPKIDFNATIIFCSHKLSFIKEKKYTRFKIFIPESKCVCIYWRY